MAKKTTPAIVLMMKDNIRSGVMPSKETLKAVYNELDEKHHFLSITLDLLETFSGNQVAPKAQPNTNTNQTPNIQPQATQMAPKVRQKPKVNPNAVVQSAASLNNRVSIVGNAKPDKTIN